QGQRQSQVVQRIAEDGFAGPGRAELLQLPIPVRQRDRVVERMMRPTAVDPEAVGEVLLLATVLRQRSHQRERVVERKRVDTIAAGRGAPEHRHVELHAVVGNQEVLTNKGVELREYFV